MATATASSGETGREPRLALGVTLERILPGLPSVDELASVVGVLIEILAIASPASGPFDVRLECAQRTVLVAHEDHSLVVSGGVDGTIQSWWLDGQPGPLNVPEAHEDAVWALAVVEHEGQPMIVTSSADGALRSWRLDGQPGPINVPEAHRDGVLALVVVDQGSQPLIVSSGADGALRSWRLDGEPGPLQIHEIQDQVLSLVAVENDGQPLIVGSVGRAIHTWWPDGRRGPYEILDTQVAGISTLAVLEHEDDSLLVGGCIDGQIRSWHLGEGWLASFEVSPAHAGSVSALLAIELAGQPLIVSGGADGAIRSWWLDGQRGPLDIPDAHVGVVLSLGVAGHDDHPLFVSSGSDGAIRSWPLQSWPPDASVVRQPVFMSLGTQAARQLEVRRLCFASPLEIQLHLPEAIVAAPAMFGFVLYAIKRLWGYPIEIRTYLHSRRALLLKAEQECERLQNNGQLEVVIEALSSAVPDGWEMTGGALTDEDE